MTDAEMLDTVKLLLDITDTSQDAIVTYYISALKRRIVNLCGLPLFPIELSDLVVDIVIKKMKDDMLDGLDSIKIGDTNIKTTNTSKNIIGYLDENMSELQEFMYTEVI